MSESLARCYKNKCVWFYVENKIAEGGRSQSQPLSDLTWDSESLATQLCQTAKLKLSHLNHRNSQTSKQESKVEFTLRSNMKDKRHSKQEGRDEGAVETIHCVCLGLIFLWWSQIRKSPTYWRFMGINSIHVELCWGRY